MQSRIESDFCIYLKSYHKGKRNAITARELAHWGTGKEIRTVVHKLRLDGYPICSGQTGYYFAETAEECRETVMFIGSYLKKLRRVHYALLGTLDCMETEGVKTVASKT